MLCRQLCHGAGVAVEAVHYCMGPEQHFPAAVDGSIAATRWLRAHSAALGLDADALSAAGKRAQYVCFGRQIHGFITMGKLIDEAETAVVLCATALRRSLRPPR